MALQAFAAGKSLIRLDAVSGRASSVLEEALRTPSLSDEDRQWLLGVHPKADKVEVHVCGDLLVWYTGEELVAFNARSGNLIRRLVNYGNSMLATTGKRECLPGSKHFAYAINDEQIAILDVGTLKDQAPIWFEHKVRAFVLDASGRYFAPVLVKPQGGPILWTTPSRIS